MIQKIRTAKLPGNCLYSALKLPKEKAVSESDTAFCLPLHIIRNLGVGPSSDLGQSVHADVEQRRRL